jgi:lysophospholipid acyltransferase (LPLAT)-like uncharacterized protein
MTTPAPPRRPPKPRTRFFNFTVWLGGVLFAPFLRLLGATWRIESHGEDPAASPAQFLVATWHQGLFCGAYRYRDRLVAIPVSQSRDGDRIDAALQRLGFGPSPRGSSSRGGSEALAAMIAAADKGQPLGILADGPRGPARKCKPGAVAAGRATGLAIRPIGIAGKPALRFPSWDRAFLPLPFARVVFVYPPPLTIARDAGDAEFEKTLATLEVAIEAAQVEAERIANS